MHTYVCIWLYTREGLHDPLKGLGSIYHTGMKGGYGIIYASNFRVHLVLEAWMSGQAFAHETSPNIRSSCNGDIVAEQSLQLGWF